MDLSLYGFSGLNQVFNVHPAFVHFPIALLPVTLLFYALGLGFRQQAWLLAGRACLYLSLLATAVTVATGFIAEDSFPHNEKIHEMIETHQATGLIVLGITAILTLWSFWHRDQKPRGAWVFVLVTAIACYFVLQNGDIGSRMVFVEGAAVKPAVPIVAEPGHKHGHPEDEHNEHPKPSEPAPSVPGQPRKE